MSEGHLCQLLALLGDDEPAMWSVVERAVELAEAERARLTLAQLTDPGWMVSWCAPLAMLYRAGVSVEFDFAGQGRDRLARAAEMIPGSIPLTTVLLGRDTAASLRRLVSGRHYDLAVLGPARGLRGYRLLRALSRLELPVLIVSRRELTEEDLLHRRSEGMGSPSPS